MIYVGKKITILREKQQNLSLKPFSHSDYYYKRQEELLDSLNHRKLMLERTKVIYTTSSFFKRQMAQGMTRTVSLVEVACSTFRHLVCPRFTIGSHSC